MKPITDEEIRELIALVAPLVSKDTLHVSLTRDMIQRVLATLALVPEMRKELTIWRALPSTGKIAAAAALRTHIRDLGACRGAILPAYKKVADGVWQVAEVLDPCGEPPP